MKGFLRFSDYGGTLGAIIGPKHYVLPLLAHHFCSRFGKETFMSGIRHIKRPYIGRMEKPIFSICRSLPHRIHRRENSNIVCCGNGFTTPSPSKNGKIPPVGARTAPSDTGHICTRCRTCYNLYRNYDKICWKFMLKSDIISKRFAACDLRAVNCAIRC